MIERLDLSRRFWWALGVLTLASLLLRTVALDAQPLIPDDVNVGFTATSFSIGGWPGPTMWNHPRLRDLLIFGSLRALGEGALGLKLWSVVLGTLSVPAVAALVLVAGGGPLAALVAAAVVGSDGLHLDFSRQGINDVYLAFFAPAAAAAALRYRATCRPGWLLGAGLLLGLGLASKHSVAFPVAAVALLLLVEALRAPGPAGRRVVEVGFGVACLAVLPLTLYLATSWPWFGRGHDLGEWLRFQLVAARETATHVGYPGTKLPDYFNELVGAWRWFVQPIWYVDDVMVGTVEQGDFGFALLAGVGNPLTWLLVWPSALLAAWRWRRRGDAAAGLLLALFLAAYLPFALAPRPIWSNSAVAVLPFAAALIGLAGAQVRRARPRLFTAWAVAAAATAVVLWPPAAGFTRGPGAALVEALVPPAALTPRAELLHQAAGATPGGTAPHPVPPGAVPPGMPGGPPSALGGRTAGEGPLPPLPAAPTTPLPPTAADRP